MPNPLTVSDYQIRGVTLSGLLCALLCPTLPFRPEHDMRGLLCALFCPALRSRTEHDMRGSTLSLCFSSLAFVPLRTSTSDRTRSDSVNHFHLGDQTRPASVIASLVRYITSVSREKGTSQTLVLSAYCIGLVDSVESQVPDFW